MRVWISEFWREHKREVVLGLVFAVLFGLAWEVMKVTLEHAEHVPPDRLAAGTVRVMVAINLKDAAQRQAVAEWEKSHPSVIATKDLALLKMGSGFAVSDEGWIVTARHVVNTASLAPLLAATGAKPYIIVNYPPYTERQASLVEEEKTSDTAILKTLNAPPARYLVLGDPEEVHRLDRVFAGGYPSAADYASVYEPTITAGEISKIGKEAPLGKVFQTTAPIGPGNSGGPLMDGEGHVIGMNIGLPLEKDMAIGFAVSIEHARKILARRGVALPSAYERQGILRQPWILWTAALAAAALLIAYFGVSLRSLWRRRFKSEADPPYAGFWVRFAAFIFDVAVVVPVWLLLVVLLIFATGSFFPWYGIILGLVPAWCAYEALCEWRWGATIGKRVAGLEVRHDDAGRLSLGDAFLRSAAHLLSALPLAIGFIVAAFDPRRRAWHDRIAHTAVVETRRRSPWAMLAVAACAFVFTLVAITAHWGILEDRANRDLRQVHSSLWSAPESPASPIMGRRIATANDRAAFWKWTPLKTREDVFHDYGVDLMLAGLPRRALSAFQSAAGAPWETFGRGTGFAHTTVAWAAATKAGWCFFDAGDLQRARQMFEDVGTTGNLDASLGLGVTLMRLGDSEGARAACLQARAINSRAVEQLASSSPQRPVSKPFYLTPSQLRAVQEMLAICGDPQTPVTAPESR